MPCLTWGGGTRTGRNTAEGLPLDKERHFAVRGNSAWTGNGGLPLAEIPFGQAAAIRRLPKFRPDKERRNAAHGNSVLTVNGNPPFVEIPLGRATAIRRSREFHFDEQRRSAVRKNSVRVISGGVPLTEIPLGQGAAVRLTARLSVSPRRERRRRGCFRAGLWSRRFLRR